MKTVSFFKIPQWDFSGNSLTMENNIKRTENLLTFKGECCKIPYV